MKKIDLIYISLLALAVGCRPSAKKPSHEIKEEDTGHLTETGLPGSPDDKLVIPGKQAGEIFLGQNMEDVGKILGRPFDGGAAMGKAWSIWHISNPGQ